MVLTLNTEGPHEVLGHGQARHWDLNRCVYHNKWLSSSIVSKELIVTKHCMFPASSVYILKDELSKCQCLNKENT